jgi:TRAP-type C4-dicarboxylate transport system permease small subunit
MNKKLTSTILLFSVFIGFLWWGISMLVSTLSAPVKDGESIVYAVLILGCAGYAMFSILMLPRKNNQ